MFFSITGRAALQKRIMALLRQLDRQTAGNMQVQLLHYFAVYGICMRASHDRIGSSCSWSRNWHESTKSKPTQISFNTQLKTGLMPL